MTADTIAAMGAFLTGAGAVLGAMRSMKRIRKAERSDCDERVAEIERVFKVAYEKGMQVQPRPRRRAS